jgi:protoporphyrinogen/coproporphyrinogen III oxidase
MKTTEVDVVVIGAGITGLVAALHLMDAGKKVVLVEKNDRTGGQLQTVTEDGFVFETGPNTGVINNSDVIRLFERLHDRIQPETARKESKVRLIWKGSKFHALPNGLISAVSTPLFTFRDKIRICFEPWRPKGSDPMESVGALARRRLGKSFFQYAIDPFVSGVYAGDPDRLVTRFALPKLYNLEQNYGSFIRGSIKMHAAHKMPADPKVTKQVFSAPGGFGQLAQAITDAISLENIRLSAGKVEICPNDTEARFRWKTTLSEEIILSNSVVTTIPAYVLPEIVPFADTNLLDAISCMPYAPVIQVGVGIRSELQRVPMAFGGLVPSCESKGVLGILFPSSCFENRAPQGGATLSFFLGGRKHPEMLGWSDDEIRATVEDALVNMLGFPRGFKPDVVRIFRHERAIPQYEADSEARLKAIAKLEAEYAGLVLAGGIRDGIGLGDRVRQGSALSELEFNVSKGNSPI